MPDDVPKKSTDSPPNKANAPKSDNKKQEGPDRLSPQLDDTRQWSKVAAEPAYQKGHQGGYKGSPDETKFDHIRDDDLKRQPGEAVKGDDDGRKTPMRQNERTSDKRESN